jgi:hypothetical protein
MAGRNAVAAWLDRQRREEELRSTVRPALRQQTPTLSTQQRDTLRSYIDSRPTRSVTLSAADVRSLQAVIRAAIAAIQGSNRPDLRTTGRLMAWDGILEEATTAQRK